MNKKIMARAMSFVLCGVMSVTALSSLASCTKSEKDSIVLMTEELSGLFNPFYATSGTDMDVVGMTQIGMLSTDSQGNAIAGDNEATVVKAFDWEIKGSGENAQTVYTFVLKNGLKFSDGVALSMNDVMFSLYELLDPVYTGSSTLYSTDIVGLTSYRTQQNLSGSAGDQAASDLNASASSNAALRILTLAQLYQDEVKIQKVSGLTVSQMEALIEEAYISDGYKLAVATDKEINGDANGNGALTDEDYQDILLADYQLTLKTFKEELESDFKAAKESYDTTTAPYNEWAKELENDVFKFFLYEGYIKPKYAKKPNSSQDDKEKIESFENTDVVNKYPTMEQAIQRVYDDMTYDSLDQILMYWGTAGTLQTQYTAEAIDIILHNRMEGDGLTYPNISGIVSLGHTTSVQKVEFEDETTGEQVSFDVAHEHNEDGTPKYENTYDVLQITVNGTDPKAIYNFGFTVAPAHYYTADEAYPNGRPIDIANNKFGVEWADSDFQSKTIQSQQHVEVPVGAGAYMATDDNNSDNPKGSEFWKSNIVYFKANKNFQFDVKTEKIRMQVVSSTNAIDKLSSGEVDYITPQFTKTNSEKLDALSGKGIKQLSQWQLGYGYIGVNAGKVPDLNIRKAIMAAMDTSLALEYYVTGTCENIDWPMSRENWAYPYENGKGSASMPNGKDYLMWEDLGESTADAEAEIKYYMSLANNGAGVTEGDDALTIRFTIAGASITEHPTYAVFKQAAEILNSLGWNVEVKADSQALTKLSTGSLEVWAAAWGSTIDPDMYQVYHKNSTATSVYAWGYREILAAPDQYPEETKIINDLSVLIDEARESMDRNVRIPLYEQAMSKVLELAVEMPVYQRQTLYAYNSKTVKGFPEKLENSYVSPLENIWDLELIK